MAQAVVTLSFVQTEVKNQGFEPKLNSSFEIHLKPFLKLSSVYKFLIENSTNTFCTSSCTLTNKSNGIFSHVNSMFVDELVEKLNKMNKNLKFTFKSILTADSIKRQSWGHESFTEHNDTTQSTYLL